MMKTINRILLLLCFAMAATTVMAQDSRAYTFVTDTKGDITKDANGNAINMSSVSSVFNANTTNQNTSSEKLPFQVVLLGKVYNNFMIGSSGYIVLGNDGVITEPFLFPNSSNNSFKLGTSNNYINQGVIAPFWDFQKVKSVKYTTTGTAPNRCFVVEWQTYLPSTASPTNDYESRYQARIYENSGEVEFVYGQMKVVPNNSTNITATIGISRSSAISDFAFAAVTDLDSFEVVKEYSLYTNDVDALYNKSDSGAITPLHTGNDTACRRFVFTPDVITAPTNLKVFDVKQDSALLYWDDNSSDELQFELLQGDRNNKFTQFKVFAPNVNFYQLSGLLPSTTYKFKVRGYNQGQFSGYTNTLVFKTLSPNLVKAKKSGLWSDTATWGGVIPAEFDSVVINNGYTVTLDIPTAKCYNIVADNGTLLFQDTTHQNKVEVGNDVEISSTGAIIVAPTPKYSNLNNELNVRGSLINNGTLKLYDTANLINTAAARLVFYNIGYSEFTGNPAVNDIYEIAVVRSGLTDSVIVKPSKLTVRGSNIDAVSGNGFLVASNLVGTIKLSGNFKLQNRLFTTANATVQALGSVWLDNDSIEIVGQKGNYIFSGGIRISKGIFNVGTDNDNIMNGAFDLRVDGGELNVSGALYSNNAKGFTQTGGIIRVATVGNTTTLPSFGITNTVLNLSGGEIIIKQPGLLPNHKDYLVTADVDKSELTGGVVKLGEVSGLTGGRDFIVGGIFPQLNIDSALTATDSVKVKLSENTAVYGVLNLSDNDVIELNGQELWLYNDSVNVEGNIKGNANGTVVVAGKNKQTLYGKGKVTAPNFEVYMADAAASFIVPNDSILQTNGLGLTQGKLVNTNYLQLGDSVNNINVVVGKAGANQYAGVVLDSMPTLHQGAGKYNLSYVNLDNDFNTGYEVPVSRKVNEFTVNTDFKVAVTGGGITAAEKLSLTKGVLETDATNFIYLASGETADLSIANNSYIKGPLTRRVKANSNGTDYNFPVGIENSNAITLQNVTTDSNAVDITVANKNDVLTLAQGNGITAIDTAFGFWYIKADSNINSLKGFNLNITYKLTDGFVRFAGGKAANINTANPIAFDSIGTRLNNISPILSAEGLTLSNSNPVLFVAPGEYLGDTIFAQNYKIGAGEDFENLTQLSRKLNSAFIAEDLIFSITNDYDASTEEFPIFFDQLRYVNGSKKIKVQLDNGVFGVTTANDNKAISNTYGMIAFFGIDSIEFDGAGRDILGEPTGTREWTFRTDNNGSNAAVFRYENDSRGITLNSLNIHSNANNSLSGAIHIGGTNAGNGNDYNTFRNCEIKSYNTTFAYNGIISYDENNGTATNDSITIEGCEFDNIRQGYVFTYTNTGIGWTVTKNHFYQSNTSLAGSASYILYMAAGNTTGGFEFSYNYAGGSEKFAKGSNWLMSNGGPAAFIMNTNSTHPSVFKGNIIRNIFCSSTSTATLEFIQFNSGIWEFSGNKVGGTNSYSDEVGLQGRGLSAVVYVTNNTAQVSFYNNDFSYISHPTNYSYSQRRMRAIYYTSNTPFIAVGNKFHHFDLYCYYRSGVHDGTFHAVYLSNNSTENEIRDNEVYEINNRQTNTYNYMSAFSIVNGGGVFDGNYIHDYFHTSTYNGNNNIAGVHFQGAYPWVVSNNRIILDQTNNPNLTLSMQCVRMYNTSSTPSRIINNTLVTKGQTKNTNSWSIVQGSTSARIEVLNNILINDNDMTGGSSYRASTFYAYPTTSAHFKSDFNLFYVRDNANMFQNHSNGSQYSDLSTWQNLTGQDKNSIFGFIPQFKDFNANDLHLTSDTVNWPLKATGTAADDVNEDFEKEARHKGQPDIGADEFNAPTYLEPVYVSGNTTLCAGNTRTLVVSNPNSNGNIYWFAEVSGGDTLHQGNTLITGNIDSDTVFYASISDSLKRSHRLEIHVKIVPILVPNISTLPQDSICSGTALTLTADSVAGGTIEWFATMGAGTPFYTGRTVNTGALTTDTTFYIKTTLSTCQSNLVAFPVEVSSAAVSTQTLSNQTVCSGSGVVWNINGPDVLRVYDSQYAQGSPIASDTTFDAGVLTTDTTFYYEVFNGSCIGNRKSVSVTVNTIPAVPTVDTMQVVCYGENLNLNPTASGTINWYANDSTTNVLTTGAINLTNIIADTVLYTNTTLNNCESERIKVSVKVLSLQKPTLAFAQTPVCINNTALLVASHTATGTIEWFADKQLNTQVGTGDSLTRASLNTSSTFYFHINNGICKSDIDSANIVVTPLAAKPTIQPVSPVCYGEADTLVATSTGTIQWFEGKTAPVLQTGGQLITQNIVADKKYYVKAALGTCESELVEVLVPVRALPQPAVIDTIPQACRGKEVTLEAKSNQTVEWYNSNFATTPVATGLTYTTPQLNVSTTYYVQTFDGVCRSSKRAVPVSLRNAPALPQLQNTTPFCWGDEVSITATSTGNVRWYENATSTQHFLVDETMHLGKRYTDTSFYVESFDGVCASNKIQYTVDVIEYLNGFSYSIPDSVDIGKDAVLQAQGPDNNLYSWNFGNDASISSSSDKGPHTVNWNQKGIKKVRLVVSRKQGTVTCDTIITKEVKIYSLSEYLAVGEVSPVSGVNIYPNPATSTLYVSIHLNASTKGSLSLQDALGRTVWTESFNGTETINKQLDVTAFAKGIYFLKVSEGNHADTYKVIVE